MWCSIAMVGEGALLNSCGSLPKKSMFIDVNNARDMLPNRSSTASCQIARAPGCEAATPAPLSVRRHSSAVCLTHLVGHAQRPAGPIRAGPIRAGPVRGLQKMDGVDQLEREAGVALC